MSREVLSHVTKLVRRSGRSFDKTHTLLQVNTHTHTNHSHNIIHTKHLVLPFYTNTPTHTHMQTHTHTHTTHKIHIPLPHTQVKTIVLLSTLSLVSTLLTTTRTKAVPDKEERVMEAGRVWSQTFLEGRGSHLYFQLLYISYTVILHLEKHPTPAVQAETCTIMAWQLFVRWDHLTHITCIHYR